MRANGAVIGCQYEEHALYSLIMRWTWDAEGGWSYTIVDIICHFQNCCEYYGSAKCIDCRRQVRQKINENLFLSFV